MNVKKINQMADGTLKKRTPKAKGRGPGRPASDVPLVRVTYIIPAELHEKIKARVGWGVSGLVADLLAGWLKKNG